MGTAGYMAPEQARGDASLDARSDIYALGAILFELLTLEPLHTRKDAVSTLASTINGANARASVRAPQRDIPPELDQICVTATAIDREDRFASARALHEAIEGFLDGDRDLDLRRSLAASHAATASISAKRALSDASAHDERRVALREVGRALALDPENGSALRTMVSLLVEPPREVPPQARAALETSAIAQQQFAARIGGMGYLFTSMFIPLLLWMGIRDWYWAIGCLAVGSTAIMLALFLSRQEKPSTTLLYAVVALTGLAVALVSRIFGPFFLAPYGLHNASGALKRP